MAKAKLKCKVCGKMYEACRTPNTNGVFRWFDVACCREHAQIYLQRVLEARGETIEHRVEDPFTGERGE